ncbi:MAG: hypothetical protein IKR73_02575 [Oscillospiraceae bacterium]|nr:hypothetical protein [Oscillospiraceae bacterium]
MKRLYTAIAALMLTACVSDAPPDHVSVTETVPTDSTVTEAPVTETDASETASETASATEPVTETETTSEEAPALEQAPSEGSVDDTWRQLYKDVLYSDDMNKYGAFSLFDIDGDDVPELICSYSNAHSGECAIFTVKDGELGNITMADDDETMQGENYDDIIFFASFGTFCYYPGKHRIYTYYAQSGYSGNSLFELHGTKLEPVIFVESDENSYTYDPETDTYTEDGDIKLYVDGERVDEAAYRKAVEEFKAPYLSLGRTWSIRDDVISAVFDDIGRDDAYRVMIRAEADSLSEWSPNIETNAGFMLCDIDGDGDDELILGDRWGYSVYTYDGGLRYIGSLNSTEYVTFGYGERAIWHRDEEASAQIDTTNMSNGNEELKIYVSPDHTIVRADRQYNGCVYEYKDGFLGCVSHYDIYPLTDGTYLYTIEDALVTEDEYNEYIYDLNTKAPDAAEFKPIEPTAPISDEDAETA